jgi:hypothetical protein
LANGITCDFSKFNNTLDSDFGEDGVFCEPQVYTYQTKGSRSNQDLVQVYEHPFQVRGTKGELITYWYEIVIGVNFMVSSGIKVLLSRNDHTFDKENPYICLFDKSCVEATLSSKSQLKLDLILTSGLYKLTIFEYEDPAIRRFITEEAGL